MRLPVMPPVAPMLATPVDRLPEGPFSFEPKWDGFRAIVFRDGDEVEIGSRNERPMTRYFPEVVEAIRANLPTRCVVDGEPVVPDPTGGPLDFEALQQRIHPAASRVRLLAERTPPASRPSTSWPWTTGTSRGNRSASAAGPWRRPSPRLARRCTSRPPRRTGRSPSDGSSASRGPGWTA